MNIEYTRRQFPGLRDDFIFFDNAGGSQISQQVIEKVNNYFKNSFVQLGASYPTSRMATKRVYEAQKVSRILMNAKYQSELVIGSSSTMLLRQLSQAMLKNLNPGDEIIVTNCDHEANVGCWKWLERFGIKIKIWKIEAESLELRTEDLEDLMTDKTVLVAFTHASNVLGTINPVKEITQFVHDRGALVCIDGVAYAPHRAIDVQALDVDFYAYSFYKTYGPHQAVLYGKKELLLGLDKLNHFFIGDDSIPYKLQPGGPNHELSFGITGILDYFNGLADANGCKADNHRQSIENVFDLIATHEENLSRKLLSFLNGKDKVRIIGNSDHDKNVRVPTISFVVEGMNSREITLQSDKHDIGIRFGDFYAHHLINDLDLRSCEGVVRVSMVHYNTEEEVEKLISVLEEII